MLELQIPMIGPMPTSLFSRNPEEGIVLIKPSKAKGQYRIPLVLYKPIQEIVLGQITTARAKISLSKCKWCWTKVNYISLLIGADGVKPQVKYKYQSAH